MSDQQNKAEVNGGNRPFYLIYTLALIVLNAGLLFRMEPAGGYRALGVMIISPIANLLLAMLGILVYHLTYPTDKGGRNGLALLAFVAAIACVSLDIWIVDAFFKHGGC